MVDERNAVRGRPVKPVQVGASPIIHPSAPGPLRGLLVQEEDAVSAGRKSGCDSPAVHW